MSPPQGKKENGNGFVTQYMAPRSDDASLPTLRLRGEHNFSKLVASRLVY